MIAMYYTPEMRIFQPLDKKITNKLLICGYDDSIS